MHSRLSLTTTAALSQGGIWLPWAAMVEKGFVSAVIALSRYGLKTSTNSMAHVEVNLKFLLPFRVFWMVHGSEQKVTEVAGL